MSITKSIAEIRADNTQIIASLKQVSAQMDKTLSKDANKSTGAFKGAMQGLFGAIAINKIASFTQEVANMQDRMIKMGRTMGLNVEQMSGWSHAVQLGGGNMEMFTAGIRALSRNVVDANRGIGEGAFAFKALGINVNDSNGKLKDSEQIMFEVSDKFSQMEDGATKSALAQKIFGKSGTELINTLNQGSDALREQIDEGQKLSGITEESAKMAEEFNDTMLRVGTALRGAGIAAVSVLMKELKPFSDWFIQNTPMIRDSIGTIAKAFSTTFKSAAIVVNSVVIGITKQFEWAIDGMATALDALPDSIVPDGWVEGLKQAGSDLESFNDGAIIGLEELADEIVNTWSGEETKSSLKSFQKDVNDNVVKPLAQATAEINAAIASLEKAKQGEKEEELKQSGTDRGRQQQAAGQAASAYADARANAEIRANERIAESDKKVQDKRKGHIAELGSLTQSTFETAFRDMYDNGTNGFRALATAFKDEFINQSIKLLAQMATRMAFSGFGGGAQGGSLFGSLLGIKGFASGTNYAPGGMAVVGERGPEVVNLQQGSQVQPSYTNNTTNNYSPTFNIQTQSGEDNQALARRLNDLGRQGFLTSPFKDYGFAGAQ